MNDKLSDSNLEAAAPHEVRGEQFVENLLAVLRRRKGFLILSCILGLLIGALYYAFWPVAYESRAEILLMKNDSGAMASGSMQRGESVSEELLATHMKLLQSRRIVSAALGKFAKSLEIDLSNVESVANWTESIDKKIAELEFADRKIADNQIAGKKIDHKKIAEIATTQAEFVDTKIADTKTVNTKTVETEIADKIADKEIAETEIAETEVTETEAADTEAADTEIAETEIAETEILATEIGEADAEEKVNLHTEILEDVIERLEVASGGSGASRNAHVLRLFYKDSNSVAAQLILEAIIQEYQEFVKAKFQSINELAFDLINKANNDLEKDISKLDEEYRDFRVDSPLISSGSKGSDIHTARYEELAAEYSKLAVETAQARGRLELVKSSLAAIGDDGPSSLLKLALIDERNAERLKILVTVGRGQAESAEFQALQPERMAGATVEYSSLLTMKSRLSQLRNDFGPEYPEAKALEQQIQEMQTFLDNRAKTLLVSEEGIQITPDDVMSAYVNMLENDLRALDRQSQDVQSQMKQAEDEAKKLVSFILQDEQLLRMRARKDDLYNSTIERLQAINMQQDSAAIVQELIESPDIGEVVEPKLTTAAALSIISTILLATLVIQLAEFRDSRIHSAKELERILDTRVVGHICNFDRNPEIRKLARTLRKSKSTTSPNLVTHHLPNSRISEGFRAIRTQILFSMGANNKIIGVTSAMPSSGKSTIAGNFAVSLASAGHKTILVDCDLRLPQVHDIFGIANDHGLTDAIQGKQPLEKLLVQADMPNLTILPTGAIPANPAELLSSPQFRTLLAQLKADFAYVVLDCPPVLPVSDPSIIAPLTDGLLFIAVVKNELKPQIERAKEILHGAGGQILGCIVNRADDAGTAYGYGAYGYESATASDNYFPAK